VTRLSFLALTDEQVKQIVDHVRSEVPREACGLIAGRGGVAVVTTPMSNVATDPVHHYEMDNDALSRQLPAFTKQGLELIGIYHSHPRTEPFPSPEDVQNAFYPNTAYLIISLKGKAPHLAAWLIERGRVEPLELFIGEVPPPTTAPTSEPLSYEQKFAVILSALLAFALLIILSFSLLPPAPPIPN
jgi:[CysO sulfur-carrier protein]-S-L-cysteine hydrolase